MSEPRSEPTMEPISETKFRSGFVPTVWFVTAKRATAKLPKATAVGRMHMPSLWDRSR